MAPTPQLVGPPSPPPQPPPPPPPPSPPPLPGVDAVLGCVVLRDAEAFRVWNVALWVLGLVCTASDLVRFAFQEQRAEEVAAAVPPATSLAFDMPIAWKLLLRWRLTDMSKKML